MISYGEVRKLNRKGNVIPVHVRVPADLDTPVLAFMKLAARKKDAFLLESIEGGEKLARYSFLGFDPFLVVEGTGEYVRVSRGNITQQYQVEPRLFLNELFSVYKPVKVGDLPRFTGGAVGYFAYDTARWLERLPDENPDDINLPEMRFGLFSRIVAFDHLRQEIVIIANILHDNGAPGLREKYNEAVRDVREIVSRLEKPAGTIKRSAQGKPRLRARYTQSEYCSMVTKAKRFIKEGDIFQVVLSQRWDIASKRSELEVYRRLRRTNPSPYMFLIKFGSNAVIGSSPEMLVRVEKRAIETRPIAGTRPRGSNEDEDARLIKDLLADQKELAEHTMLLDLGRNDIGRVAAPGSVRVKDNMIIEKYSHVIHIVSSVVGQLSGGESALDGLLACFPAGTVSGAPKIRAMEIIDELEKLRRGVYAGAVTYLDFWGNLDSCIAIRTVVKTGTTYFVQAGAGIVADSKPMREFRETWSKAQVVIDAVMKD